MANGQTEIAAGFIYTQNDGEVAMVGFADKQYDTRSYIMLQRTLRPSSDDVRRGWDQVHICLNDEAHSAYGGVSQISLRQHHVSIEINPVTATCLGTAQTICIDVSQSQFDAGELASMLQLVGGKNVRFNRPPS